MSRYIVLGPGPLPFDWAERAAHAVQACDWWISAEFAGVEEDDPAVRLAVISGAKPVIEKHKVATDHGRAGRARIEPLDAATLAMYPPPKRLKLVPGHGYSVLLEQLDGPGGRVLLEGYQAIAIGLSQHGAVRTPENAWWDAAEGTWVR